MSISCGGWETVVAFFHRFAKVWLPFWTYTHPAIWIDTPATVPDLYTGDPS